MNKLKTISSISLGVAVLSLSLPSNLVHKASALSNTLYTLTNEDYKIQYTNNTLTLTFSNSAVHNNITTIKLKDKNGKYLSFDKNSENFTLKVNEGLVNSL